MRWMILPLIVALVFAGCAQTNDSMEEIPTPNTDILCPDGITMAPSIDLCPPVEEEVVENLEPSEEEANDEESSQQPLADQIFAGDGTGTSANDVFAGDGAGTSANEVFAGNTQSTSLVEPEVTALRERAAEKTAKGYSFTYYEVIEGLPSGSLIDGARVHVGDEKIAFEWESGLRYEAVEYQYGIWQGDTVTLVGQGKEDREVSSDEFELITPVAYLNAVEDVEAGQSRTVDGRSAQEVTGILEGQDVLMIVDTFSGVPMSITQGERTERYQRLALSADQDILALA